jgi:hypothetical protein
MSVFVPAGYEVRETDECVGELGGRLTRRGAEHLRAAYPPMHPGLRYEIERRGGLGWDRWVVVGYQNVLERETPKEAKLE